jgi:hypothetical protein
MKQLETDSRTNPSPQLIHAQKLFSDKPDVRLSAQIKNYQEMSKLLKGDTSDNY